MTEEQVYYLIATLFWYLSVIWIGLMFSEDKLVMKLRGISSSLLMMTIAIACGAFAYTCENIPLGVTLAAVWGTIGIECFRDTLQKTRSLPVLNVQRGMNAGSRLYGIVLFAWCIIMPIFALYMLHGGNNISFCIVLVSTVFLIALYGLVVSYEKT